MKPSIHIKFKPLGLGLVCTAVTAMATCYVAVEDPRSPCHEMQMEHCTNGCVRVEYNPAFQSYCDSHDGECGRTDCRLVNANMYATTTIFYSVIDGPNCWCQGVKDRVGPILAGTCVRAELSGDRCGYCP